MFRDQLKRLIQILALFFIPELQVESGNKKRKILGYISAEQSFLHELTNIGFYDDSCFYV